MCEMEGLAKSAPLVSARVPIVLDKGANKPFKQFIWDHSIAWLQQAPQGAKPNHLTYKLDFKLLEPSGCQDYHK